MWPRPWAAWAAHLNSTARPACTQPHAASTITPYGMLHQAHPIVASRCRLRTMLHAAVSSALHPTHPHTRRPRSAPAPTHIAPQHKHTGKLNSEGKVALLDELVAQGAHAVWSLRVLCAPYVVRVHKACMAGWAGRKGGGGGGAKMAVAGGSPPRPPYRRLCKPQSRSRLPHMFPQSGRAEWLDKGKRQCLILWKKVRAPMAWQHVHAHVCMRPCSAGGRWEGWREGGVRGGSRAGGRRGGRGAVPGLGWLCRRLALGRAHQHTTTHARRGRGVGRSLALALAACLPGLGVLARGAGAAETVERAGGRARWPPCTHKYAGGRKPPCWPCDMMCHGGVPRHVTAHGVRWCTGCTAGGRVGRLHLRLCQDVRPLRRRHDPG